MHVCVCACVSVPGHLCVFSCVCPSSVCTRVCVCPGTVLRLLGDAQHSMCELLCVCWLHRTNPTGHVQLLGHTRWARGEGEVSEWLCPIPTLHPGHWTESGVSMCTLACIP